MTSRTSGDSAPRPRDADARLVTPARRSVDTRPETALRRALHSLGFRYRVNLPLPAMRRRRSDLTFARRRTAVFVRGCFWHACPQHLHAPRHNAEWWWEKLRHNVRRDEDTDSRLVRLGWIPLRIWEHETVESAVAGVVEVLAHQGHPRAVGLGRQWGVRGRRPPSTEC